MGKRELLLVIGFVIAGMLVYQVTAPAPKPGDRSISLSGIIDHIRRQVGGNRSNAELRTNARHPAQGVSELRIRMRGVELTVTGEDRDDIASELRVTSTGYDDAEAQQLARESKLSMDAAPETLTASIEFPRAGIQRGWLVLRVPTRLRVRVEPHAGRLQISNVGAVEIMDSRGETQVTQTRGRVVVMQRAGGLTISQAASLKVTARNSDVRLSDIRGDATLQLNSGELRGEMLTGAIDLESNGTDVTLDKLEHSKGPIRINASNCTIVLRGVRADARIDGRNAGITLSIDQPTPVTIYNEGDEPIEIIPPPGGFQLDALASDGQIRLPEGMLTVKTTDHEERAAGAIAGGGPTITLRAMRGDIRVLSREPKKPSS